MVYLATTTQLSRMAETLRADGRFTEPAASELMLRTWHLEGLAVRPDHRMTGHTGFLLASRRLAPGTVLPAKRSRPAKGAYGADYTGPGSPGAADAGAAGEPMETTAPRRRAAPVPALTSRGDAHRFRPGRARPLTCCAIGGSLGRVRRTGAGGVP